MKILFISDHYPPYVKGGAEVSTSLLVSWLKNKHSITVICSELASDKWTEDGVIVYPIIPRFKLRNKSLGRVLTYAIGIILKPLIATFRIVKKVRNIRPDLINIVPSSYHFIPIILILKLIFKIPFVIDCRDYSLICPTYLGSEDFDDTNSTSHGYRCLKNYNTGNAYLDIFAKPFAFYESMVFNTYKSLLRLLINNSHHTRLVPVSRYVKKQLMMNGFKANKITVINNISPVFSKYKEVIRDESNEAVFTYAGRIQKAKGIWDLIEANNILVKKGYVYKINIAGTGEDYEKLKIYIAKNSIKNLRILGNLRPDEVLSLYKRSSVVVAPCVLPEPLGRFMLEAMATGKPVISTFVGGTPEIIENGINGILVEPNNVDQLAIAMEKFIIDPGLSEKMKKSILREQKKFSSNVIGNNRVMTYRKLLN